MFYLDVVLSSFISHNYNGFSQAQQVNQMYSTANAPYYVSQMAAPAGRGYYNPQVPQVRPRWQTSQAIQRAPTQGTPGTKLTQRGVECKKIFCLYSII